MFGFIEREQILSTQNVYDLLHNTRIGRKGFAFILIGLFFTYLVSNWCWTPLSSTPFCVS